MRGEERIFHNRGNTFYGCFDVRNLSIRFLSWLRCVEIFELICAGITLETCKTFVGIKKSLLGIIITLHRPKYKMSSTVNILVFRTK